MSNQMTASRADIQRSPVFYGKYNEDILPMYLARKRVDVMEVAGKSVPFGGSADHYMRLPPLMKSKRAPEPAGGVASGQRSCVISVADGKSRLHSILVKGCGNGDDGVNIGIAHHGQPLGGQTMQCAMHELNMTAELNKVFRSYGYTPVREPAGRFDYDGLEFDGEPCSASVYLARGDTRLDELMAHLIMAYHKGLTWQEFKIGRKGLKCDEKTDRIDEPAVALKKTITSIGSKAGGLLKAVYDNGYVWGTSVIDADQDGTPRIATNAHTGNFVIFPELIGYDSYPSAANAKKVASTYPKYDPATCHMGMVDFDSRQVNAGRVSGVKRTDLINYEMNAVIDCVRYQEAAAVNYCNPPWWENVEVKRMRNYSGPITKVFKEGFEEGMAGEPDPAPLKIDFINTFMSIANSEAVLSNVYKLERA